MSKLSKSEKKELYVHFVDQYLARDTMLIEDKTHTVLLAYRADEFADILINKIESCLEKT